MAVLNTTSPTLLPEAPMPVPRNTVPSAKTKMAGLVCDTGCSLELDIKKRDEPCVHPAFELAHIIAEAGWRIKWAPCCAHLMELGQRNADGCLAQPTCVAPFDQKLIHWRVEAV